MFATASKPQMTPSTCCCTFWMSSPFGLWLVDSGAGECFAAVDRHRATTCRVEERQPAFLPL